MCGKISNHIESKSIQYKPVNTDFSLSKIKIQPLGQNPFSKNGVEIENVDVSDSAPVSNIPGSTNVLEGQEPETNNEDNHFSIMGTLQKMGNAALDLEKQKATEYFKYNCLKGVAESDITKVSLPDEETMNVELEDGSIYVFNKETKNINFLKLPVQGAYYFDEEGDVIWSSEKNASYIFNENYNNSNQYGGNQMVFKNDVDTLLENEDIYSFLTKEFPDASEEDYRLYMMKICNVGCGYVALVNSVFEQFQGNEKEFKETFGFPMYKIDENNEVVFNYEPLILAYFTYMWRDYYGHEAIEDIYGNVSENVSDGAIDGNVSTGATGHYEHSYYIFKSFLSDKYELENYVTVISRAPTYEVFSQVKEEGNSIICGAAGYDLYKIDPNTGERGSIYLEDGGGHAMTITGYTDQGDMIVSSWGNECILDVKNASYVSFVLVDIQK